MARRGGGRVALGLAVAALLLPIAACGFDPCLARHGTVVLAGHVLNPPFVIETIRGELCVNGRHARPGAPPVAAAPPSDARERSELIRATAREVDSLRGHMRGPVIVGRAIARFRASPRVDSARSAIADGGVAVWWRGERWPEIVPLDPWAASGRGPAREDLERALRESVCRTLEDDGLVILGTGGMIRVPAAGRDSVLAEIDRIRRGLPARHDLVPATLRAEIATPRPLELARRF